MSTNNCETSVRVSGVVTVITNRVVVDVWVIASARVVGLKKEEQERQKKRVCEVVLCEVVGGSIWWCLLLFSAKWSKESKNIGGLTEKGKAC